MSSLFIWRMIAPVRRSICAKTCPHLTDGRLFHRTRLLLQGHSRRRFLCALEALLRQLVSIPINIWAVGCLVRAWASVCNSRLS